MVGYYIFALVQSLVITFLTWISFPTKRRLSPLYAFIVYSIYYLLLDTVRNSIAVQQSRVAYFFVVVAELITLYIISLTQFRGDVWKNFLLLAICGTVLSKIYTAVTQMNPLTRAPLDNLMYGEAKTEVPIISGLAGLVNMLIVAIPYSLILRHVFRKDKYNTVGIYRVLALTFSVLISFATAMVFPVGNLKSWSKFEYIVAPIICVSFMFIAYFIYRLIDKRRTKLQYVLLSEELRDMNAVADGKAVSEKLIAICPLVSRYLTKKEKEYSSRGVVFEFMVDEYVNDYIRGMERELIEVLEDVYDQMDMEFRKGKKYVVTSLKYASGKILINIESNPKYTFGPFAWTMSRKHTYITDKYYRCEKTNAHRQEITILYNV